MLFALIFLRKYKHFLTMPSEGGTPPGVGPAEENEGCRAHFSGGRPSPETGAFPTGRALAKNFSNLTFLQGVRMTIADFLKGKWLRHPLHPVIIHIPMGLWPAALIFDLFTRIGIGGNALVRLSFFCIALGLAATLFAVPTGLVDWTGIKKEKPAWKIGLWHMAMNLIVTALFAANFGLRFKDFQTAQFVGNAPLLLSGIGVVLLFFSGYLGGLMVYDRGISVARMSKNKWRRRAERGGANVPPEKEKK